MQVAIPLFPRFTALDGIGPYEVLQRIPDVDVTFVGHARGEVRSENGFLGVSVECAQCHNHPFADWKREQFWGLAAFFAGIRSQRQMDFLLPGPEAAARVADYYRRNHDHFAPFATISPWSETEECWRERLPKRREEHGADRSLCLFAFRKAELDGPVVAAVNFTNIARGVFQACNVGYNLDREAVGRCGRSGRPQLRFRCAKAARASCGLSLPSPAARISGSAELPSRPSGSGKPSRS